MKYVIITPARNEEDYIRFTLDSVVAQTHRPTQWIIVDDGSTDNTAEIVASYADRFNWIKLVKHPTENIVRAGGAKVVRAFYFGYKSLDVLDYEIIVKLDADLTLPTNYFEEVAKAFKADPQIGLCGGYLLEFSNGEWKKCSVASYHLRGAIKSYHRECFEQIGGLPMSRHWEFLDGMQAMSLGWQIEILPLAVRHHRKTSTLINRGLKSAFAAGKKYYKDGYDLPLALLRSATYGYRNRPYILTSIWFLSGFIFSVLSRPEKDVDPSLQAFIRKFQYTRIKNFLLKIGNELGSLFNLRGSKDYKFK